MIGGRLKQSIDAEMHEYKGLRRSDYISPEVEDGQKMLWNCRKEQKIERKYNNYR
jgi:hypothetical protein